MTRDLASKSRLLAWAEDQAVEFRTRYILEKLASFADAQRHSWAAVAYLARVAQCSERKVQYCLAALKSAGLIKDSGRRKRLDDSTRSVPVYLIAPGWNEAMTALVEADPMGADPAPIDAPAAEHGCTDDGVWVHRACTPKDPKDPTEFANAHGAGGRDALAEGYAALEAATHRRVLAVTDPDEGLEAYRALAAEGVEVSELAGCVERWAASPEFKSRKFPVGLHVWLAKRQYRGWWPEPASEGSAVGEAAADAPVHGLPDWVCDLFGAAFVASWLRGAVFEADSRTVVTRIARQRDEVARVHRDILTAHDLKVRCRLDVVDPSQGAK